MTTADALLLALGFTFELAGRRPIGRWLYLTSALAGGFPIFRAAIKCLVTPFDLTAGLMVSIAMAAALAIGTYSAAAMGPS